jgi:formylglycine-generating enzyme required for sulfatase activity
MRRVTDFAAWSWPGGKKTGVRDQRAGSSRGLRGGNWNNNSNNLLSSNRNNNNPTNENNNIGFRVAIS